MSIALVASFSLLATAKVEGSFHLTTGSKRVTGSRSTAQYTHDGKTYPPPPAESYGWNYGYLIGFNGTTVTKHIEIDFVYDDSVSKTDPQKTAWEAAKELAIETQWNNKFEFDYGGVTIAAAVNVTLDGWDDGKGGKWFDQTVTVKPGPDRAGMKKWYWDDSNLTNAHEFGHMMGLYDEYWGGALNPAHFVDTTSLMGSISGTPAMPDRYYQQFKDYVAELQIPEPTTIAVWGALFGMAFVYRRVKPRSRRVG